MGSANAQLFLSVGQLFLIERLVGKTDKDTFNCPLFVAFEGASREA